MKHGLNNSSVYCTNASFYTAKPRNIKIFAYRLTRFMLFSSYVYRLQILYFIFYLNNVPKCKLLFSRKSVLRFYF